MNPKQGGGLGWFLPLLKREARKPQSPGQLLWWVKAASDRSSLVRPRHVFSEYSQPISGQPHPCYLHGGFGNHLGHQRVRLGLRVSVEVAVREGLGRVPVSRSPRLALLAELSVPKEIGLVSEGSPIPVEDADLRLSLLLTRAPLALKASMARVVSYRSGICSFRGWRLRPVCKMKT